MSKRDGCKIDKNELKVASNAFKEIQPFVNNYKELNEGLRLYLRSISDMYKQIDFDAIRKELESFKPIVEFCSNQDYIKGILESSKQISDEVRILCKTANDYSGNITWLSGLRAAIRDTIPDFNNYKDIIKNISKALALWEYGDEGTIENEEQDCLENIPSDLEDAVVSVCKGEASDKEIKQYDTKWHGRIIRIVIKILKYIVFALVLPAYASFVLNPVFKTLHDILLYSDKDDSSSSQKISKDTEIEIWSDDKNQDYIEISYKIGDETVCGYIKNSDLEKNTIIIKDGVDISEATFVAYCINIMADYWHIESGKAYEKLNDETNMIYAFLVKNYDALSRMSDEDLQAEIDKKYNDIINGSDTKMNTDINSDIENDGIN